MNRKWYWAMLLAAPLLVGLTGCGKKESDTSEDEKPTVALPTAETPIDKSYISDDFVGAVVIHPARMMNSKFGKDVQSALNDIQPGLVDKGLDDVIKNTGVDPRKLEQIVLLMDERATKVGVGDMMRGRRKPRFGGKTESFGGKTAPFPERKKDDCTEAELQPGFPEGKESSPKADERAGDPDPAMIFRFSEAVDTKKILDSMAEKDYEFPKGGGKPKITIIPPTKIESDGMVFYKTGQGTATFVDDNKTLIVAHESLLKKMLKAKNVDSPLTKRLATLGAEHDLIVALAGPEIEKQFAKLADDPTAPKEASEYLPYLKKAKSVAITASVSSDPLLSVVVELADADSASGLATLVNDKAIPKLKEAYDALKSMAGDEAPPEAVSAIDELVEGLLVGSKGSDFIVSIKRPSALDDPKGLIKKAAGLMQGMGGL